MPAEGLEWLPDESVLTDTEIVRLIHIGVHLLGIREVRFTGGEPLVRRGLVDIVAGTRAVSPDLEISMTTNALGLARTAHALNAVLLRGHNDDQAPELLRWCLEHGYDLRFIEQMPLDAQHGWSRAEMITADEIFTSLEKEFVLSPAV